MFEDEMTEDHVARTLEEYRQVTEQEVRDEQLALAKADAAALQGWAASLRAGR